MLDKTNTLAKNLSQLIDMNKTPLLAILFLGLILSGFKLKKSSITDLESGDRAFIANSEIATFPAISPQSDEVCFVTTKDGQNLLRTVNLLQVELKKRGKGLYFSKNLKDLDPRSELYKTILSSSDTSFYNPEYSLKGTKVMCLSESNEFKGKPVYYDFKKKRKHYTKIDGVYSSAWKSDSELMLCFTSDSSAIYSFDLTSQDTTLLKRFDKNIKSLNRQKQSILVAFHNRIENYSNNFNYKDGYPIRFAYEKAFLLDELNLITTNSKDQSVNIDFNNNVVNPLILGSKDINPVLSYDMKYVVVYSKSLKGIILRVM